MTATTEPAPPSFAEESLRRDPPGPLRTVAWVLMGLCAVLALVVVFFLSLRPIAITDFWWQARTGEIIVRTGSIPHHDLLSWTAPGRPWVVHEWLTEVFFYYALVYLPEWVLLAFKCGLAVLACALVMARGWLRSGSLFWGIVAAIWAAYLVRNYADLRPQMVSFVLIAGLMLALEQYRTGRFPLINRWLPWLLPLMFVLWVNLHGGIVVGLILACVWVVGEALGVWFFDEESPGLRPLAFSVAACFLAVLVNPNGFHVYLYPFEVLRHPKVMDFITEWYAPNFHNPAMKPFQLLLLSAMGVGMLARGPGRVTTAEALVVLATAHAALTAQRNTAAFGLVAAPVVVGGLAALWRTVDPLRAVRDLAATPEARVGGVVVLSAALATLLVLALPREHRPGSRRATLVPPGRWFEYGTRMDFFPHYAVEEMKQGAWPGRLYNDYVWGGYLAWKLWPQRKVFIDGRAEVYYPDKIFDDEMTIFRTDPGWDAALDKYGIGVVLTHEQGYLGKALARHPGWVRVFDGPVEAVFLRADRVE